MNQNSGLFSVGDFLNLSGASLMVVVITNSLYYAFALNQKYTALVSSFLISLAPVCIYHYSLIEFLMIIPNAFLIFATSIGLSTLSVSATSPKASSTNSEVVEEILLQPSRKWLEKWF